MMNTSRALSIAVGSLLAVATLSGQQPSGQNPDSFRFKSGVELINVTATVADSSGRFVPDLTKDDFIVYEDDVRQTVSQFSAERVPVSLGIALDTSGSMAGEKIEAARGALDRFLSDLLDNRDEVFIYRFSDTPMLVQPWTSNRSLGRVLDRIIPEGGTALYDAVSDAVPMATRGRNQKKALVIISDGNDTSSHIGMRELKQQIRQSEVLVYAVGIDSESDDGVRRSPPPAVPRRPPPVPYPFPPGGGRRPGGRFPVLPQIFGPGSSGSRSWPSDDRVNVVALRDMTDDSGGRTEIVRYPRDIDPATASIADELSKQYYLGYTSTGTKDGRWHAIRVELKNGPYRVRARRGYFAN
jgi:VWFA-related protein